MRTFEDALGIFLQKLQIFVSDCKGGYIELRLTYMDRKLLYIKMYKNPLPMDAKISVYMDNELICNKPSDIPALVASFRLYKKSYTVRSMWGTSAILQVSDMQGISLDVEEFLVEHK